MRRSARRPEPEEYPSGILRTAALSAGAAISRNPVIVGGGTAFLVTLFFVSANAIWYQPFAHPRPLFATRNVGLFGKTAAPTPLPETSIRIERGGQPTTKSDPMVQRVQSALSDLKLYAGPVDGIAGPQTHEAVAAYQRLNGLEPSGTIDNSLLDMLGTKPALGAPVPMPAPRHGAADMDEQKVAAVDAGVKTDATDTGTDAAKERISRIQAGLKAFGNDAIEIDGVMGGKTRAAIVEFQSLFGLPESGEPDAELFAKMQEIGLIN